MTEKDWREIRKEAEKPRYPWVQYYFAPKTKKSPEQLRLFFGKWVDRNLKVKRARIFVAERAGTTEEKEDGLFSGFRPMYMSYECAEQYKQDEIRSGVPEAFWEPIYQKMLSRGLVKS